MKVGIGIPISDSVPAEAISHLMLISSKVAELGFEAHIIVCQDVFPVCRAREVILDTAIEKGMDYLFWVDSDVIVPRDAFAQLWSSLVLSGAAMVSGHYFQRGGSYESTWSVENKDEPKADRVVYDPNYGQLILLVGCGLGCALFDMKFVPIMTKPFFRNLVAETGDVAWEDGYFCSNIIQAGGLIFGSPSVECGHLGKRILIHSKTIEEVRKM